MTTVEEAILFARRALSQHAVFQKVLETEPDTLLPQLTVDDSRLRGLVAAFLQTHLEPEKDSLASGVTVEGAADHVARLLMSFMSAEGSWDLSDPAQVHKLVRTELLAGVFAEKPVLRR